MNNTTTNDVNDARQKLNNRVASMTDAHLIDCATLLAQESDSDRVVVRVAVLHEYETRHGGEAVDLLMDSLGM